MTKINAKEKNKSLIEKLYISFKWLNGSKTTASIKNILLVNIKVVLVVF